MSRTKVLQLGKFLYATKEWAKASEALQVVVPQATSRPEFLEECRSGKLDGVVAAIRGVDPKNVTGLIDEELVQALPKSLKFICHNGAGYDNIDVSACTTRRIQVSNVADPVNDATADTAMFLVLGALRNYHAGMTSLQSSKWLGDTPIARDPQGKVLGILGMGGIGEVLAQRAQAFGMSVQYHNRNRLEKEPQGCKYVSFDDLLATSDVLSLNLPLNPNTKHIISHSEFSKMKQGITVVNTARGAVIDEEALVQALDSGKVGAVGLDVFENEPKIHPGLLGNPHAFLLPHMGTYTIESRKSMEEWTIGNLTAAVETGKLKSRVKEQANF